jgi:hypothetical protein
MEALMSTSAAAGRPAPSAISPKVVRLERGKHERPERGVCVAELVSMLADEPFTDRPSTACPAVMGFLRGYNDGTSDEQRQDLYALAADLVGSRRPDRVAAERAKRIREFGRELAAASFWMRWRLRVLGGDAVWRCEPIGYLVAWRCRDSPDRHAAVLAFVRELLGAKEQPPVEGPAPSRREAGRWACVHAGAITRLR